MKPINVTIDKESLQRLDNQCKREGRNRSQQIRELIKTGRLPISFNNINLIPMEEPGEVKEKISNTSIDADLTIIGFNSEKIKTSGYDVFTGYDKVGNVLFVSSNKEKEIK